MPPSRKIGIYTYRLQGLQNRILITTFVGLKTDKF